jgi:energy-coupling factor transporter ATP-binding protein EcfA2
MYSYSAYGLGIRSEILLPELNIANDNNEFGVQIRKLDNNNLPTIYNQPYLKINPNEIILSIEEVGSFEILKGSIINVSPAPNIEDALLRRYIIGTVMALLLYQRELLVLHASALNINGTAVAFLGNPGSGKSSIAAALHKIGHEIITDDVSAIDFKGDKYRVFPGYPQIKLSDDVARSLGFDINSSIKLDRQEEKRGYRVNSGLNETPIELRQIFILTKASSQGIERITHHEGLIELIRHSYPTRFAHSEDPEHFIKCVNLVNTLPLYRLNRSSSLQVLPKLAQLVENNLIENG